MSPVRRRAQLPSRSSRHLTYRRLPFTLDFECGRLSPSPVGSMAVISSNAVFRQRQTGMGLPAPTARSSAHGPHSCNARRLVMASVRASTTTTIASHGTGRGASPAVVPRFFCSWSYAGVPNQTLARFRTSTATALMPLQSRHFSGDSLIRSGGSVHYLFRWREGGTTASSSLVPRVA
jgi:hypothetical protein